MQNIAVCCKWVIDERDVSVDAEGNIDAHAPSYQVGPYDRNAIEAAVQLGEANGVDVVAFSAGDEKVAKSRKEVLSMGPASGVAIIDSSLEGADGLKTATVLAAAIKSKGDFDLIVCGEGSSDLYAQQVGPRIAAALGLPFVGYVTDLQVDGDKITLHRACSEGVQALEATMPLVVSVAGDCNDPRIPGVRQVLAAGKKPFEQLSLADIGCADVAQGMQVTKVAGKTSDRKQVVLKGTPADIAADLVKDLVAEGVLA